MIVMVGVVVTLIGLVGYSLISEKKSNDEKILSSVVNFYMIVCFTLFVHMYTQFYGMDHLFVELFFGISMIIAAIYLMSVNFFRFKVDLGNYRHFETHVDCSRLVNGTIYASVIWLIGKELTFVKVQPFMIPGLILLPVFFVLVYPVLVVRELRLFFLHENISSIVSNSFLVVLFSGIAIISMSLSNSAYIPIESLAAITALYFILKMSKSLEPFIE